MRKLKYLFICLCVLMTCFGCSAGRNENAGKKDGSYAENAVQNVDGNTAEVSENLMECFDSITDDMLASCNTYPELDSYWNDSLVLLNAFNDNIRLYGISAGEESAMLLCVNDEKLLLNHAFKNVYQELPKMNNTDIDDDGSDEIIISFRTGTGSPKGTMYALVVCDYDAAWNIYEYNDVIQDIDALIDYTYYETHNEIFFSNDEENILIVSELPEWTEEHPYEGKVEFDGNLRFNAETMTMEVTPYILLKDSLPYSNVTMVFSVGCTNGEFEIKYDYFMAADETESQGKSENQGEIITKYIDSYVKLDSDTKIESTEWLEHNTDRCLRIRVQYKEQPEKKYKHKEDYFIFCDKDNQVKNVLQVDYKNIIVGSGNDFNAYFEDVTFDGNEDLLIHTGSWGNSQFYCAFIYDDGNYCREESFESIPNYKLDAEKRQIVGTGNSIDPETVTIYVYDSGKFQSIDMVRNDK